jgi:ferric-dicitrate binding protein FerR (iron transport regulator)
VQTTKASLYADWIKDRLVFDKSNLSDVLTSMEGRYNVEIEYPQRASATRVSLTIRQESLEEVLEALSLIVPIHYQLEGNKVEITYR